MDGPTKALGLDDSDIASIRSSRLKWMLFSAPARIAAIIGGFVLGAEAGAQVIYEAAPSTYPYCVAPVALMVGLRGRRFLALLGLATALGLAAGYLVVGPAYSQEDALTGGTYYGVWSPEG